MRNRGAVRDALRHSAKPEEIKIPEPGTAGGYKGPNVCPVRLRTL